jgi:hypothetical protein
MFWQDLFSIFVVSVDIMLDLQIVIYIYNPNLEALINVMLDMDMLHLL